MDVNESVDSRELVRAKVAEMVERAKALEIKTDEDYRAADEWQKAAKKTLKVIDEAFDAERTARKLDYDRVLEAIRAMKSPIDLTLPTVVKKMTDYVTEKEKARRKAEEDAREAERKRVEDDRLVEAQNLSSMGRQDDAEKVLEKRVSVSSAAVRVAMASAPAKLGKTMEKWVVTVTDLPEFLRFAAGAHVSIQDCVTVNVAALAALARQNKGLTAPGLEVKQTFVPVA